MAQGHRPDRVGEQIRDVLSEVLARGEVHDPGIGFITLTRVQVTTDLQLARVFYTTLGDQKARTETSRALHLGKDARIVNHDPAPGPYSVFPGVTKIEVASRVDDPGDAVIVMECGDLTRTGVEGLERGFVINIDHHIGNTAFGALNWFDASAAACSEMVFDLVRELDVPLTREIATHIYIGIITDTGSFHYSNISPRTFDICRRCVEAGIEPPSIAPALYASNTLGPLKLFGAGLGRMVLHPGGRVATLCVDRKLARECGGTYEDTEGIVNLPLSVKDIEAVGFFKEAREDDWPVSMRSKGGVDVNAIPKELGAGGH